MSYDCAAAGDTLGCSSFRRTDELENIEVEYGPCCFCGKPIAGKKPDPCSVSVSTNEGLWQGWSCHGRCFRERLTQDPEWKALFEPVHF